MNLSKLFEMQKVLRDRIGYNEPDRFDKLILALLVEVGECANEWRGFKYWSKDQEPRLEVLCHACNGQGHFTNGETITIDGVVTGYYEPCQYCQETGIKANPLLEEYVDGLHFVLELGIEIAEEIQFDVSDYFKDIKNEIEGQSQRSKNTTDQFNYIAYLTTTAGYDFCFEYLFAAYFHLGEMLGFTWEQIEQAYMEKNKINHERQESGY